MGLADDLIQRQQALESERSEWDRVWRETAELVMPRQAGFGLPDPAGAPSAPTATRRARQIYDSTGLYALDRFAAALESMITPRAARWHRLRFLDDALNADDAARRWLDDVTALMFRLRYAGAAGFAENVQEAYRSVGALGNAVLYVEEGFDGAPVRYRTRPLAECYLALDFTGRVDTVYRRFALSARQAVQRFGAERLSGAVRRAAARTDERDRRFQFLHAVQPRAELGPRGVPGGDLPVASVHVEIESRHLVGEGGYHEFPYVDLRLQTGPGAVYAEGPAMLALADLKMLQAMARTTLRAAQKITDPPLAVAHDGVMERPNLNPGALNPGALSDQGRMLIQPIQTASNPGVGLEMMEQRREAIREGFYVNLFQVLVRNPQMTATEAMIRAQEKGELLGPAGGRLQAGLHRLIEREFAILARRGLFDADGPYAPPGPVAADGYEIEFTSPLDRARRAEEGAGTLRTLEALQPLAAARPEVLDNIDADEMLRGLADINGMPGRFLTPLADRDAVRAARAAAVAQTAQVDRALEVAEAAGRAAPALDALTDADRA